MQYWLAHSLRRYYPASPAEVCETLALEAARGERVSFQILTRSGEKRTGITAEVTAPEGIVVRVRRVGYVPMFHVSNETPQEELEGARYLPGLVPDPLLPEQTVNAGCFETNAFWVTLAIPTSATPGPCPITVSLRAGEDEPVTMTVELEVHPAVLPKRRDFPVTHWFYADALLDWYKLQPFEERFWTILDAYFANLTTHGQDTIYVPVFTPPLDGVKRPTQLLHVQREGDRYLFDWTLVRRWVDAARANGLRYFEWTHLFTQWGVEHALRVYAGHGEDGALLWPPETGATSATYRNFLAQFLPEFEHFLREESLLDVSFFHLSDEPHDEHLANYRAARELLRELAPWMPVMDALSQIAFARQGLTDLPVPIISEAPAFVAEGFAPWTYYCCGPCGRYLNRFLDTPLLKVRMSGWLFYRTAVRGFLHWGYNCWYRHKTQELLDPFMLPSDYSLPYGDAYVVYPGADGPVDSLRWEVFTESLQDYTLLQAVGIDPQDPMLAEIRDYADFPRDAEWIAARRRQLLQQLDTMQGSVARH